MSSIRRILAKVLQNHEETEEIIGQNEMMETMCEILNCRTTALPQELATYLSEKCGVKLKTIYEIVTELAEEAKDEKCLCDSLQRLWLLFRFYEILGILRFRAEENAKRNQIAEIFRNFNFEGSSIRIILQKCCEASAIEANETNLDHYLELLLNEKGEDKRGLFQFTSCKETRIKKEIQRERERDPKQESKELTKSQSNDKGAMQKPMQAEQICIQSNIQEQKPLHIKKSPKSMLKFSIAIVGDSGVGKSCFLLKYTQGYYKPAPATCIDYKRKAISVSDRQVQLQIWDSGGQERFRSMIYSYCKRCQGIILMYDITDKSSFHNLKKWLIEIDKTLNREDFSFLVIGNKSDRVSERKISWKMGLDFAMENQFDFMETSSIDGSNIDNAFQLLTMKMISKQHQKSMKESVRIQLSSKIMEKNRECCLRS